jgi:dTDP-4-dehydrorhamnose 3,5-epimerase
VIFEPTKLQDAYVLDLERREDERGFFARAWCQREFEARGLVADLVQANIGYSAYRGTVRGLHYQIAPFEEAKIVRCVHGTVWDLIIDLRPDSVTFCQWFGIELSAVNRRQLYIPKGFAHGYQTLTDYCEIFYLVSEFYSPTSERGIRWNDPRFAITWPIGHGVHVSAKDRAWPDFHPDSALLTADNPGAAHSDQQ